MNEIRLEEIEGGGRMERGLANAGRAEVRRVAPKAADNGLRLSSAGYSKLQARVSEGKIDVGAANAFMDMFLDGNVAGTPVAKASIYPVKF